MSKAISVTDTIAGAPLSLSFLVERMCEGNRVRVQPKQSCEISHHCGFAGTSQTTVPGFSPVAFPQRDVKVSVRLGRRDGGFPCLKSINSSPAPIERVRSAKHDLRSASRQKSANYLVRVLGAKLSISLVRSRVAVQVLERPLFHASYRENS